MSWGEREQIKELRDAMVKIVSLTLSDGDAEFLLDKIRHLAQQALDKK